jgi:hypothetical protein
MGVGELGVGMVEVSVEETSSISCVKRGFVVLKKVIDGLGGVRKC